MDEKDGSQHDKFGVSPADMDLGQSKGIEDSNHVEAMESKELADYYESPEFKARERRVVRKLDFYIAPLMGSFNFIVSFVQSCSCFRY